MPGEIKTIAVIGASGEGCALAAAALRAGYEVVLEDVAEERLRKAAEKFAGLGDRSRRLFLAHNVAGAVRNADLIVETVADELEMKLELFTIFDKFAKPNAILASSTGSLRIADISDVTVCRERCIGFRFCETESRVELACSPATAAEVVAACEEVARRIGKRVVRMWEARQKEFRSTLGDDATDCNSTPEPIGRNVAQIAGKT